MKELEVTINAIQGSLYKDGEAKMSILATACKNTENIEVINTLCMSEAVMRELHKMLSRHISALDEAGTEVVASPHAIT